MNDSSHRSLILLNELQQLTQRMLELIELGQLDSLDEVEQQRQEVIQQYKTSSFNELSAAVLGEKLKVVAELDHELNQQCQVVREQLASQLKNIQNGKRVKAAYRENTP